MLRTEAGGVPCAAGAVWDRAVSLREGCRPGRVVPPSPTHVRVFPPPSLGRSALHGLVEAHLCEPVRSVYPSSPFVSIHGHSGWYGPLPVYA